MCDEAHGLRDCPRLLALSVDARSEKLKKIGVCFGCLLPGHIKRNCKARIKCDECGQSHNSIMHGLSRPQQTYHHQKNNNARIALRTIPVKLSFGGREIMANCILDDGFTCSFINSDMVKILGLPRQNQHSMTVGVLNGSSEKFFSSNVAFSIASMDGKNKFSINAMTINRVTGTMEPVNWKEQALQFKHLRKIPFWKPNRGKYRFYWE